MTTPSRLYRRTRTRALPLFTFYAPDFTLYDDQIVSVTIHRGGSDPLSYQPATIEIETPHVVSPAVNGTQCRFLIREAPASELQQSIGLQPAAAQRYTGRLATVETSDRGKLQTTTLTAASWLTQMGYSAKGTTPTAGWTITRVIQEALGMLDGSTPRGITPTIHGTFDRLAMTEERRLLWRSVLDKYIEGQGIVVRETMDGRSQFMTLAYLNEYATTRSQYAPPVGRHQAISPARWQQRNERPTQRHEYTITNETGGTATRVAELTTGDTGEIRETVAHDWAHIRADTLQTYHHAYALAWQTSTRQLRVPSVTVDLLLLLSSSSAYDRELAAYLLSMETYDPIGFTDDWPTQLRGWMLAVGITETITPDSWTLELELFPWNQVTGQYAPPRPDPRTWAQARGTWAAASGTWAAPVPDPSAS